MIRIDEDNFNADWLIEMQKLHSARGEAPTDRELSQSRAAAPPASGDVLPPAGAAPPQESA